MAKQCGAQFLSGNRDSFEFVFRRECNDFFMKPRDPHIPPSALRIYILKLNRVRKNYGHLNQQVLSLGHGRHKKVRRGVRYSAMDSVFRWLTFR